ncbi:uncharacterized protein LOC129944297 [Eupeodes corollae]|uniref:uncharacterized protein LOC129944297 n=1 Tax=Eupeodes corollae TaxID=290404 RepID=UPI00248FEE7D|nr:uncharacterized protein LOC129944297 [Eupeodes corollae]
MTGKKRQQSPKKSADLEHLVHQRLQIKNNIIRIKTGLEEKTLSLNPIELECRLDILNSYIDQLMNCQSEIESEDRADDSRGELEDICVGAKALLISHVNKRRKSSVVDYSFSNPHHSRLPKMSLPKFSGKYSEYKNFISLFESLVDNDPMLSDIEKFNHLISCLSGAALGTVKAFQITEQNYPKALASLKKVYDNNCLIFFDNVSTLFELKEISKPSASSLRSMIDTVSAIYDSLLSLGDEKNITNAIIIHLVMSKVDAITRSKWEEQLDFNTLPLWKDCEEALNKRYQHLSAEEASSAKSKSSDKPSKTNQDSSRLKHSRSSFACVNSQQNKSKCLYCKSNDHYITTCQNFTALPVQQRFEYAKSVPICINCLRKGHTVSKCKMSRCSVCNRSHHTLLHQYESTFNSLPAQPSTSFQAMHASVSADKVILATALVQIKGSSGEYMIARALLDSGSQLNFITEELAQRLKLRKEEKPLNLLGIGKASATVNKKVHAEVKSRFNDHSFSADYWVMNSISSYQPDQAINTSDWNIPSNIQLADPYFNKPQKIDLLIGADTFFELLSVGQIKQGPEFPTIQKTIFGWIISGKYPKGTNNSTKHCNLVCQCEDLSDLDEKIPKLWLLEEFPGETKKYFTPEQQLCEKHFVENTKLLPTGRFEVKLPFKLSSNSLGSSFETAKRRFLALERKLSKNSDLRGMYMDFMKEYILLGHMSPTNNEIPKGPHYFIPHQCVLRPQSTSTKLRVVFDASSRTSSQLSLNDILMVGPTIQEELFSTLLRFRTHKYAITADITKMYRQVLVAEEHTNYQLIVWRQHPSQLLQIFRLNTVTYGTSPAPFLAIRCLQMLGDANESSFPTGSDIIRRDFYVDDLLTGADNLETLKIMKFEIQEILTKGGFQLAKWFSNHPEYLNKDSSEKSINFNDSDFTKTLGMCWHPKEDTFSFNLDNNFHDLRATKRNILSVSARLFDPLGLLCPIVTKAKILLQELWVAKIEWDESIPLRLDTSWQNFKTNLSQLGEIKIPRFVETHSNAKIQVHGFADASTRAYGCCIYIRSQSTAGIKSTLLTAKSRVAPLKTKSIPRLELCAAHTLAKLWTRVEAMLSLDIDQVIFWTDSEITLHWIKTHPSTLATFVANRVSDIQEWTQKVSWRHVPTKQNPADILSRGCNVEEINASIWFKGPQFLLNEQSSWPVNSHFELSPEDEALEKRKTNTALIAVEKPRTKLLEFIEEESSYNDLITTFAYIMRFFKSNNKTERTFEELPTAKERNLAFLRIVEIVQSYEFPEEIEKLRRKITLQNSFQKLNPFIHDFQDNEFSFSLIRVGGRLFNAPIEYDKKFPLLLTKNSPFVRTCLTYLHRKNYHAGPQAMVALLREKIWLINAKDACQKVVRQCINCFKYKPKLLTQIMGNLPADRLRAQRPFLVCGVDFCGPVHTTLKIRGRSPNKTYICVFVCFASKAVHIELASNLSSECFILVLKRFICRRGLPKTIYCDNGTNFVGAQTILREIQEEIERGAKAVRRYAAEEGFNFALIPPRAPHFGGLWEAAVKAAKTLLQRTVGNALLTTEELLTVVIEVEGILNSRPIAPLSADPNDGEALTPAHLLIGSSLRSLPPEPVPERQTGCLKRWQLLCWLKQQFWLKWSKEYLLGLQARSKWVQEQPNLVVGKLVVIHEDNSPPQRWKTGRVIGVVEGQDGKVRVADVKTSSGVLRRPIVKLAPLPDEEY